MKQVMEPFLRSGYNYDRNQASDESGLAEFGESVTQQQFREECDINEIVRRFGLTGELPDTYRPPVSGDFTEVTDFYTAMLAVRRAEESFLQLPGQLRARFNNDPGRFLEFIEDAGNREEAEKLGLLAKPLEADRNGVPVAPVAPIPVKTGATPGEAPPAA